jgi:membrane protein
MASSVYHPDDHENVDERQGARGRTAHSPTEIPARGWWDIAMRVKKEMAADNVDIIASGLALYALLAVFPALAAAVSIYGLFSSPADIADHLQEVAGMLPGDVTRILQDQLGKLSQNPQDTLSFGIIIGIALALWSARKGMVALMKVTNVAYDEEENRGFFRQLLVSLAFTIGAVIGFLAVVLLGVAVPLALSLMPLGSATEMILLVLRWVLLFAVAVLGLAVVYRFAPDRTPAQWRWLTPGSLIAATLWLIGSVLFAVYVRYWGSYGETYGALGGVVVLLMWFYLSAYIIVLGAEINAETERQTKRDSTTGQSKPLGARGAYSADTVGPTAGELKES